MQTKEELEKLTVQQLKEKLKSRKLAISGAKSELVNRLYESLVAEEKLLESAGISDVDLSSVNVDEVLGLDTDTSIVEKKNDSPTKPGKAQPIQEPKEPITSPPDTASAKPTQKDENSDSKDAIPQNDATKPEAGDSSKIMLKNAVKLGLPISEDRKVLRAQRFGPVAPDGDDKKAKRAARFGITTTDSKSEPEDKEKILKRAQRFGIPVKEGAASNSSASSTPEVLEKRAKRFGLPAEDDMEDKKKARLAKFGIVTP